MGKINLVFAAMLLLAACTKSNPPESTIISTQEQKALVESLGPGKSTARSGDSITMINSNSYSQRGLLFDRYDQYTLRLRGMGLAPSVITLGSRGLANLPLTTSLRLEVNKVGAGGVDRNLGRNFNRGLDVYVIAKADGSGATMLGTPSGASPLIPKDYTQVSEVVWFVAVLNGELMRFRDVGNGECLYLNTPITDKDYRFNKNDRSATSLKMDGLVPLKAAKATMSILFFADPELPQGSSLTFKTPQGADIYTYFPLAGVSQKQQQEFQFDVPVEPSGHGTVANLNFNFSGALQNSSSSASFVAVVKGWRLFRNY